jgi:hypothetical protein
VHLFLTSTLETIRNTSVSGTLAYLYPVMNTLYAQSTLRTVDVATSFHKYYLFLPLSSYTIAFSFPVSLLHLHSSVSIILSLSLSYVFLVRQIHTTIFGTTMYFQYTIVLTIIVLHVSSFSNSSSGTFL